jgi:hypothetical protein
VGILFCLKEQFRIVDRLDVKIHALVALLTLGLFATACEAPTSATQSVSTITASSSSAATSRFASGTKAVKINTNDLVGGSFAVPSVLPATTPVPTGYPGYVGSTPYRPGISPSIYYDVDGTTVISKPSWLLDFQLGLTGLPGSTTCATFGGLAPADVSGYYRTSEIDCGAAPTGTGSNLNDRAFVRIVLDRTNTSIGSAENLLVQVEYQASGLHLNSDGTDINNPENNLDQLWKIFWNNSLSGASVAKLFSVFVPPNYGACLTAGSGTTNAPGQCSTGYKGAPTTTKQYIIPLSAYPTLSVLQFSRVLGRINNSSPAFPVGAASPGPVNYVSSFLAATPNPSGTTDCGADSPLCLGLVIRSILLMRI